MNSEYKNKIYFINIVHMFMVTALVLFISTASSNAQDALLDIKEVKSESGITAWLVENHNVPVISMNFVFKDAGAKLDPASKQGLLAHCLAKILTA